MQCLGCFGRLPEAGIQKLESDFPLILTSAIVRVYDDDPSIAEVRSCPLLSLIHQIAATSLARVGAVLSGATAQRLQEVSKREEWFSLVAAALVASHVQWMDPILNHVPALVGDAQASVRTAGCRLAVALVSEAQDKNPGRHNIEPAINGIPVEGWGNS